MIKIAHIVDVKENKLQHPHYSCFYESTYLHVLFFCFCFYLILATINKLIIMPGTFWCAANIFRSRNKELVCTIIIVLYTVKNFHFMSLDV
jgi:hypothetical protein